MGSYLLVFHMTAQIAFIVHYLMTVSSPIHQIADENLAARHAYRKPWADYHRDFKEQFFFMCKQCFFIVSKLFALKQHHLKGLAYLIRLYHEFFALETISLSLLVSIKYTSSN